jgi:hypothetical protein
LLCIAVLTKIVVSSALTMIWWRKRSANALLAAQLLPVQQRVRDVAAGAGLQLPIVEQLRRQLQQLRVAPADSTSTSNTGGIRSRSNNASGLTTVFKQEDHRYLA